MTDPTLKLLLVDDEDSVREPLSRFLQADPYHYEVSDVPNFEEAVKLLEEKRGYFDVALIDEVLGDGPSGLEILKYIKSAYSDIEVILFTGWGLKSGEEVRQIGAYSYIAKPFDADQLALTIYNAAERRRIRREHKYMEALVRASQSLTQTTQVDRQLNLAWEFVREQLDVSSFFIALYSSNYETVYFPLAFDEGTRVNLPDVMLEGDTNDWGLAGYIAKTGEEVLWSTLEEKEQICLEKKLFPRIEGEPSASCFCVPLIIGDQIRGVLSAQSYQPNVFLPPLQDALRALAGHLSVALENSRLFDEAEQKTKDMALHASRLAVLQNLAVSINSSLNLDEILTNTCKAAVDFFHADHSGLVIYNEDFIEGKVEAEYPSLKAHDLRIPLRGIPAEEHLIANREPLVIEDLDKEESLGMVRDIMLGLGIKSTLIVPVIGKDGHLLGSFSLDAIHQSRKFNDEEIALCKMFANHVAVAMENARLYRDIHEGQEYLSALYEAGEAIISSHHPEQALRKIVETACQVTGAYRAVSLLVDESGRPRILASTGFEYALDAATSVRDNGISRKVLNSSRPCFFPDTRVEEGVVHPSMIAQGVRAAACLPLSLLGKNIGVLWIHFLETHAFSETEKRALELYANQSAIAYDNARRMREQEQLQKAAQTMARETEWQSVIQQIAASAKEVLEADYTLIWPFEPVRDIFLPEELVAESVPISVLEELRQVEPGIGRTTRRVMERGYSVIEDIDTAQIDFPGQSTRDFLERLGVKSFQAICLEIGEEPLGVLYVDYKKPRGFGEEDRRVLEHFANHAALTLKRARLYEQVQRARRAGRTIAEVSALGNLHYTLTAVVEGAREVLGCDIATLYTFDDERGEFASFEGAGMWDRASMRPPSEIARDSALWRVIEMDEPYYHPSEDAPEDLLLKGGFVRREDVRSSLGIQLRSSGRRVGVMFINYRTPHRLLNDEIQDALQFARQAAVAITNAQLHEQISRRAEALKALYDAGNAITGSLALEETLRRIAEQALRIVGVECSQQGCFSHIVTLAENKLRFVSSWPMEKLPRLQKIEVDFNKNGRIGIAGRCIRNGRSQNVPDVRHDDDYIEAVLSTRSQLSVPLRIANNVIGAISVEYPFQAAFSQEDVQNLESLAAQAAVAISNAQSYEELKITKETLAARTALAWAGWISSTWGHAVQKHAITILEQIQLLRLDLATDKMKSGVSVKRLVMLERLANQILEKRLTLPLSTEEQADSISLNDLINERVRRLRGQEPYNFVSLVPEFILEDTLTVRVSSEWLRRALDILVDNAVEAARKVPESKVRIRTQRNGDMAEIEVADNGRGISRKIQAHLFHKPIPKAPESKGQGIGLLLAQMFVQAYGGTISCRKTGRQGTTMVISLPLETV